MTERSFIPVLLVTLSSMIVWALHFALVYGFTGLACARQLGTREWHGFPVVPLTIVAATAVAAVAVGALLIVARRQARDEEGPAPRFLWYTARMMAVLALAAIVWEGMAAVYVPRCAGAEMG